MESKKVLIKFTEPIKIPKGLPFENVMSLFALNFVVDEITDLLSKNTITVQEAVRATKQIQDEWNELSHPYDNISKELVDEWANKLPKDVADDIREANPIIIN